MEDQLTHERDALLAAPRHSRETVRNLACQTQYQSRRENRFRPLRNAGQFTGFTYLALNEAKNKFRFRRHSGPGIGFFAVVIKRKLGQSRKQPDQIEPALSVSFTNFPFWNVVSAVRHPGAHARDVAFDTVQTHVPNPDFNSFGERFVEKIGTRLAPERGLEGKIEFFGDGTFEQPLAFMPSRAVGFQL